MKTSMSENDLPLPSEQDDNAIVNIKEESAIVEIRTSSSAVEPATVAVAVAAKVKKEPVVKKITTKPRKTTTAKVKVEPTVDSSASTSSGASTATTTSSSSSSSSAVVTAAAKKPLVPTLIPLRRRVKRSDPSQCLEIIAPMYDLFYQQEDEYLVKPYMAGQKDINNRMRGILVDWLVEVHYKFRLQPPTLWLCVNVLDRYLEKKSLLRNRLQLLGVTTLLVACKFEEIYPPEVRDCVYITDNAYSSEEVLAMEQSVLSVLDYQLCVPTGYHFLTRYLNIINAPDKIRHLAFYYAERNLQEPMFIDHKPSKLVSAALYAALVQDAQENSRYSADDDDKEPPRSTWPDVLVEEAGVDESDLLPLARLMVKHVGEEPVTTSMRHLIATRKKYLNDKFFNVAEWRLPVM